MKRIRKYAIDGFTNDFSFRRVINILDWFTNLRSRVLNVVKT